MGVRGAQPSLVWRRPETGWAPLLAVLALLAAGCGSGRETERCGARALHVDFEKDIAPLFNEHCIACHGASKLMNGLRLDRRAPGMHGGYRGPFNIPGDSAGSRLVRLISGDESGLRMPPFGKALDMHEIELVSTWIDQGAEWPVADRVPGRKLGPELSAIGPFSPCQGRQ